MFVKNKKAYKLMQAFVYMFFFGQIMTDYNIMHGIYGANGIPQ